MNRFCKNFKETCQLAFLTRMIYFILDGFLYLTKISLTNFIFDVDDNSIYGTDHDTTCSFAGNVSATRDYIRLFVWFILFIACIYLSVKKNALHYPTLFILLFSISFKLFGGPLFFNPIGRNCALIIDKATNTNIFINLIVLSSSLMTLSFFI